MSILKWLTGGSGGAREKSSGALAGVTQTVREIAAELESLPAERARYIASFAYILGRVARADFDVSDDETDVMQRLVGQIGELPADQAALVVRIARRQAELFGATEDYLVTREFTEISTPAQRRQLLDCLFAVSAADDSITSVEEAAIREIAHELRLEHQDFIAARMAYSDKREVMKLLRDSR